MALYRPELTEPIVGAFFRVHRILRHGHLESVYQRALIIELRNRGLKVQRQVPLTVWYEGVEVGFLVADPLVEDVVLLELEAAATLGGAHEAQVINVLCSMDEEIGLLLNFGVRPQVRRFPGPDARRRSS